MNKASDITQWNHYALYVGTGFAIYLPDMEVMPCIYIGKTFERSKLKEPYAGSGHVVFLSVADIVDAIL